VDKEEGAMKLLMLAGHGNVEKPDELDGLHIVRHVVSTRDDLT